MPGRTSASSLRGRTRPSSVARWTLTCRKRTGILRSWICYWSRSWRPTARRSGLPRRLRQGWTKRCWLRSRRKRCLGLRMRLFPISSSTWVTIWRRLCRWSRLRWCGRPVQVNPRLWCSRTILHCFLSLTISLLWSVWFLMLVIQGHGRRITLLLKNEMPKLSQL